MRTIGNRLKKLEEAVKDSGFVPVAILSPGEELPSGVEDKTIVIIDDIGCEDEDDLPEKEGIK